MTNLKLSKELHKTKQSVKKIANKYRESNPEWFIIYKSASGIKAEHYSPELVAIIEQEINKYKSAPEGWMTNTEFVRNFKKGKNTIKKIADKYRDSNPEWFKFYLVRGQLREHYSPEFIAVIQKRDNIDRKLQDELNKKQALENDFENILVDVEKDVDNSQLKKVIGIFGGAQAVDILFHFYPEFKGLPIDYIKSKLAEYLGDFLVERKPLNLKDIDHYAELFSIDTFQNAMFEVMKNDCLAFYNKQRKAHSTRGDEEIFNEYIEHVIEQIGDMRNAKLDDIIEKTEEYYDELLQQKKPDNIVDSLRQGRTFPDVNQLINIKETRDKQRLLIADEMGIGKSASAILSKEYLGCSCALIVVPSNVVSTWREYLSSDSDVSTGKQKGYFKKGVEPRVLIIDGPDDLEKIQDNVWDYVIISHEKMNDRHANALAELGNDMLIVDEVHKMKNPKGVRATNLIKLSQQVEDEDQYLLLLSGTPVPNKVNDLAMTLRLLFPQEFSHEKMDNKTLVQNIINGDLLDLRNLLVPRMQMKNIKDSIEMPELREQYIRIELSQEEKDIYEVIMEEDELTAGQKMQLLRQFVLNPVILDITPNIKGSKAEQLSSDLQEIFKIKDKVVVFVNSYVENVIRGDRGLQNKLKKQLNGVNIFSVHGEDESETDLGKKQYRQMVQEQFNSVEGKMLLLVSGNTADVGVDFSGGEEVYEYNEPWTMYDRRQQLARVFREGVKNDLDVKTSIVKDTIEEGISKYIRAKEMAIEKLLRGVPITTLEQRLLIQDEKQFDSSKGVNEEIADYYFSSWDKLMKIYGNVREIGEKEFIKFLEKNAADYAECYIDLGARSYQANASRINANIIDEMVQNSNRDIDELQILDIASGPEMLKKHILQQYQDKIFSIDINKHHFDDGGERRAIGSFSKLPIKNESINIVNFSFAIHYSKLLIKEEKRKQYERIEVLAEINRVLEVGGRAIINFIHSVNFKDKELFLKNIEKMGFEVVSEYTGDAEHGDNYQSFILTLQKKSNFDENVEKFVANIGKDGIKGFKFSKGKNKKLHDSRMILDKYSLEGRECSIRLNQKDRKIQEEEQYILKQAEILRGDQSIEDIDRKEIIEKNFVRLPIGKKYILFKKLTTANGAVVIR